MSQITEKLTRQFPGKQIKEISMSNHNKKMLNDCFIEINLAPANLIPEQYLNDTLFVIAWPENLKTLSQVVDIVRLPLRKCVSALTYPSHGMSSEEFANWWHAENGMDQDEFLAIYMYRNLMVIQDSDP